MKEIKEVRKIEITEEEYKELLDYKYKYLNHQCPINYTPSIKEPKIQPYNPYYPYGQTIYCNKVNGG